MATNPKYIRLADPVRRSTLADVAGHSGFAISGYDVQEFPEDDPRQAQFAKDNLARGVLTAGTADQFAIAHPDEVEGSAENEASAFVEAVKVAVGRSGGIQEAKVQRKAQAQARALRAAAPVEGEDDDEDGDEFTVENLDSDYTKPQLVALGAARFNLTLNESDNKDVLITAILEAQEAAAQQ